MIDVSQRSKYIFGIQFSIQFTGEVWTLSKASQWSTTLLRLY